MNQPQFKEKVDFLLNVLPPRHKEIIQRRFGLENRPKETLESIGKSFGITRERIRQIEKRAIEIIARSSQISILKDEFEFLKGFFGQNGGLKREDILCSSIAPGEEPYLIFILRVGDPFFYHKENIEFYSFWWTHKEAPSLAQKINQILKEMLQKENQTFPEEELFERGNFEIEKRLSLKLSWNHFFSCVEVSKEIESNPFKEYGLVTWPEISPKSIREKVYLFLKKEGKPFHFKALAELLSKIFGEEIKANTLHNELIKNEKFVLIGRGIYALKEWGFEEGTVKELIEKILKTKGPLSKEEIIQEVQKQRWVKRTTILLNLKYFKQGEDGKYYS